MLRTLTLAAFACVACINVHAPAQTVDTTRVVAGITRPVFVTAPPGDTSRIFVVQQFSGTAGRIFPFQITPSGAYTPLGTFLTVSPVATGNEQGLLGLAFHPDYLTNGYFWVHYNNSAGTTIIARYQANAPFATSNTANAGSAVTVLTIAQPFTNHNGGWIAFGPDGYMYLGMGDGGSANDPGNRAQNLNELLGKMLRIDVDGADNVPGNDDDDGVLGMTLPPYTSPSDNPFAGKTPGRDEIWAFGLRNPWRNGFDRGTDRLFIADVGQNAIEEIDVATLDAAGINYGWRCMEGLACTGLSGCICNAPTLRLPVQQYSHAGGACSITGGYVYRGAAIPALQGQYFYADYCSAQIWSVLYTGDGTNPAPAPTNRTADLAPGGGLSIASITSFGEDAAGEMYICDQGGEVFKLIPLAPSNNSCVNPAILANNETTPFTTISATTDGPDEPGACNFNGYTQIAADVWFTYTAPCTGTARISLCGANFNTKLAVYPNVCPTVGGQAIACNDDFCDTASELAFHATMGTSYRIRIGGFQGQVGTGTVLATCGPSPPCPGNVAGADGQVNIDDLLALLSAWGPCPAPPEECPTDIGPKGGDGQTDIEDLLIMLSAWGPCPV